MNATVLRVMAGLVLLGTVASAQSLADVARREEARRKTIKTPSKLYTNESLKSEKAEPAQPASAPAASGQAVPVQPPSGQQAPDEKKAQAPDEAKTEGYWKQRLATERDGLDRSKTFADALQSRINALTTDFVNRDDPAQRAQIETDRQKALAELDRVKKEIQDHTKAISSIQEEGRKAGVPAGWLR